MKLKKMEEAEYLDYVLVPTGLVVLGLYHLWLFYTIIRHPTTTVVGVNSLSRQQWVLHMMADPGKNGVLAVQTIRNNLMAATLLATIAITLSSLISAVVSDSSSDIYTIHTTKYLSVLICFLLAFFCNMQSIRYYAHVSFLLNLPSNEGEDRAEFVEYVTQQLNRGGLFWSLGLRAFYFSFPLLLWIFGAIAMLACSFVMVVLLYFLDTASSSPRCFHSYKLNKNNHNPDIEAVVESVQTVWSEEPNVHKPLLLNSTSR
ncbi:unnamed protein product [Amaranthus hypochondriacus]